MDWKTVKEIIKGTKYVLLKNPENLKIKEKEKLTRLLNLNENINMTHILRDDLKRLWEYRDIEGAERNTKNKMRILCT